MSAARDVMRYEALAAREAQAGRPHPADCTCRDCIRDEVDR